MRSMIITLMFASISLMISSCNAIEGLGKDVQDGGKKLEKLADKHHEH